MALMRGPPPQGMMAPPLPRPPPPPPMMLPPALQLQRPPQAAPQPIQPHPHPHMLPVQQVNGLLRISLTIQRRRYHGFDKCVYWILILNPWPWHLLFSLLKQRNIAPMNPAPPPRPVGPAPLKPTPSIIQAAPTTYSSPPTPATGPRRPDIRAQRQARMVKLAETETIFTRQTLSNMTYRVLMTIQRLLCRRSSRPAWQNSKRPWWPPGCWRRRRRRKRPASAPACLTLSHRRAR